jgi:hypothetical protein
MPWGGAQRLLVKMPTIIAHMAKTRPAISPAAPARTAGDAEALVSREIAVALIASSSICSMSVWLSAYGPASPASVIHVT